MAFCTALGQRPPLFDVATLSAYMVDWVVQGFTARSLGGNLSHLRTFARRLRARFPDAESQAWFEIKQLSTALIKVDPTKVSRATVVSLDVIRQILFHLGIYDYEDFKTCPLWALQLATRMLVAHCGCLRGCEHREGLRTNDIVHMDTSVVLLRVAARYGRKKIKYRPARVVALPVSRELLSAGGALCVYLHRVFGRRVPRGDSIIMFPPIAASGLIKREQFINDKTFVAMVRRVAAHTTLSQEDVPRITAHSFRAGGATDLAAGGATSEQIKAQGGWSTECYMVYVRMTRTHKRLMARHLGAALRTAAQWL